MSSANPASCTEPPNRRLRRPLIAWLVTLILASACSKAPPAETQATSTTPPPTSPTTTSPPATSTTTTTTTAPTTTTTVSDHPPLLRFGAEGVFQVEGGAEVQLIDEPVEWVADDLMGGWLVRYDLPTEPPAIHWLALGAARPWLLESAPGTPAVIDRDGRPALVFGRQTEGDEAVPVELVVRDLATGNEAVSRPISVVGDDGGLFPTTAGGQLVAGVSFASVGAGGTALALHFWDLSGAELSVAANPFPSSCAPCEINALLSPDGSRLAYRYRPDAKWPPDETDALTFEEWWEISRATPADLVVIELATGEEVYRASIDAGSLLSDFDGRYLVVRDAPAPEDPSAFTSTVTDSAGRHDPVTHSGEVRLLRAAVGWPSIADCSAAGFTLDARPPEALPEPVAATWRAIISAATSCDVDALARLTAAGEGFQHSLGEDFPNAASTWTRLERQGEPVLRRIAAMLTTRLVIREQGGEQAVYVWPYLDGLTQITARDWDVLADIYSPAELEELRTSAAYAGLRVGIRADGTWVFAVAGG